MSMKRRYIPEGERTVVELSNRTVQSRLLLRPSPELNDVILGAIARAQRRYGVEVHGYVFLSNHFHLLASVTSAQQLSSFAGYFQSKIAKEVCRLHDWRDKVWARRYRHVAVLDEEAQHERFLYLLENSCKEGLVESPLDWPGVHCAQVLARGFREAQGTWFDRTKLWAARQRRETVRSQDFMEAETLRLSALPIWAHMSNEQYASHVTTLVEEVERSTAQRHADSGNGSLGRQAVSRQDPHRRPTRTKREPAPFVHASTKAARLAFRAAYNVFMAACGTATERLRTAGDSSGFPVGAFLPPLAVAAFDTS